MKHQLFLILCFLFSTTIAQNDNKIQQLETSVQEVKVTTNRIKNNQNVFEQQMLREINLKDSSNKQQMNEVLVALKDFEVANQCEFNSLKETTKLQQATTTNILKRNKIHFMILYILLFIALVGIVFVYVYFAKMVRDFDVFQKKRLDDLNVDVKLAIDSNHKYLVSKVDSTCDDVKNMQARSEQKMKDSENLISTTIEKLKTDINIMNSELNSKTSLLEKEQKEQIILIKENQHLKTELDSLKKSIEIHIKKSDDLFETLKKQKATAKKPVTKKPTQKPK